MGIIEAATVTPITMTITVTRITFTNTRRPRRKPEGGAASRNRWVATTQTHTRLRGPIIRFKNVCETARPCLVWWLHLFIMRR